MQVFEGPVSRGPKVDTLKVLHLSWIQYLEQPQSLFTDCLNHLATAPASAVSFTLVAGKGCSGKWHRIAN